MKNNTPNDPKGVETGVTNADRTPRREGGEDSVENMRPEDSRADEKVVINPHGGNDAVHSSFQAANRSENSSMNDEVLKSDV